MLDRMKLKTKIALLVVAALIGLLSLTVFSAFKMKTDLLNGRKEVIQSILEATHATLAGYQAQVAPLKLGQLVKAFINLDMDPKLKPEFYPYIQSCGNVVECNCVTGDYSMLIEVLFGTTQELDTFINHLQQFGRTRTQIVFSTPVEHRGLPVSEPEEEPAAET